MKFYLSSVKDRELYDDLKRNKLMQRYLREIKKEVGVEVTFEKAFKVGGYRQVVVDIPSMKALVQIMKAIGKDLVIEQIEQKEDKYPTICIYDDYIE